jgi:hypothetical protein
MVRFKISAKGPQIKLIVLKKFNVVKAERNEIRQK